MKLYGDKGSFDQSRARHEIQVLVRESSVEMSTDRLVDSIWSVANSDRRTGDWIPAAIQSAHEYHQFHDKSPSHINRHPWFWIEVFGFRLPTLSTVVDDIGWKPIGSHEFLEVAFVFPGRFHRRMQDRSSNEQRLSNKFTNVRVDSLSIGIQSPTCILCQL